MERTRNFRENRSFSESDTSENGSDSDSESYILRQSEKYEDKQNNYINRAENAILMCDPKELEYLLRRIDKITLNSIADSFKDKFKENPTIEIWKILQNFTELSFRDKELSKLLEELKANNKEFFSLLVEELQEEEPYHYQKVLEEVLSTDDSDKSSDDSDKSTNNMDDMEDMTENAMKMINDSQDQHQNNNHIDPLLSCIATEEEETKEHPMKNENARKHSLLQDQLFMNYKTTQQQEETNEYYAPTENINQAKHSVPIPEIKEAEFKLSKELAIRAQVATLQNTLKNGNLKPPQYKLNKRIEGWYNPSENFPQAESELILLNANCEDHGLENGTVMSCNTTSFVVAQFRGIHYDTRWWGDEGRSFHLTLNETGRPIYCTAALKQVGLDYNDPATRINMITSINDDFYDERLLIECAKIKSFLLTLRNITGVKHNNKTYCSAYDLLQEVYTDDYDAWPDLLRQFGFPYQGNPFVSTSDRPYHPLRYSYGLKAYSGHENSILKPSWDETGKAKNNKVGKCYVTVHPLTDYGEHGAISPMELNWKGRINVNTAIISEREMTFLAYIQSDNVRDVHISKYPSFHKPYNESYQIKYGLDESLYNQFKTYVCDPAQHSPFTITILGEWLCGYHEARLMSLISQIEEKEAVKAVYKTHDGSGHFSFQIPKDTPYRPNVDKAVKDAVVQKRNDREQMMYNFTSADEVKNAVMMKELTQKFTGIQLE